MKCARQYLSRTFQHSRIFRCCLWATLVLMAAGVPYGQSAAELSEHKGKPLLVTLLGSEGKKSLMEGLDAPGSAMNQPLVGSTFAGFYDVKMWSEKAKQRAARNQATPSLHPTNLELYPTFVNPGATVTIKGNNLGEKPGEVYVRSRTENGSADTGDGWIRANVIAWNLGGTGTVVISLPGNLKVGIMDVSVVNDNGSATMQNALVTTGNSGSLFDDEPPRVVEAISQGNTQVLVQFSEPVQQEDAENPGNYQITAETGGNLGVLEAKLLAPNYDTVLLTTYSQAQVNYTLTVVNIRDLAGNPMESPQPLTEPNPSTANFVGIASDQFIDSDGDGLSDSTEQVGWNITVTMTDGSTVSKVVTSDPGDPTEPQDAPVNVAARDTDGDGVTDFDEKRFGIDPRAGDTDGEGLGDNQELNEIFSNPADQDSDDDSYDDALEFNFFKTSPILADTDGDQLTDDEEIVLGTRNPRIADLPSPTIEVGETNLTLDVRFMESTATETRELDTKSVTSTLVQSDKKETSNTNSNTQEAFAKVSAGIQYEVKASPFDPGGTFTSSLNVEAGWTGSWTQSSTATSIQETQNAYEESLSTEVEATQGATVSREVAGARIQAAVFLKSTTDLAYSIRNLQLTVLIQDPQDPTKLRPIATLLPDLEPEDGFVLGPLAPVRGPIIFSNDTVFPQLVEQVMKNPKGLVFRISNFDIIDELGRNFAFTSQEIVERTATLLIDNGSFDADGDGVGELTEYLRVATGTGRLVDSNGDGVVDGNDRPMVFDAQGRHLGITLRDALEAVGLTHYDEDTTPSGSLTETELENSYSTKLDRAGVERIFRIRKTAVEKDQPKAWEIITPTGIDQTKGLDSFILNTGKDIKLAFVQDLDQDRVTDGIEFLNNCSDLRKDTDGDGLDDRTEVLIGWEIDIVGKGRRKVFSACGLKDTDGDGLSDKAEADGLQWKDGQPAVKTDPGAKDTDGDGISDFEEVNGYDVVLRNQKTVRVRTDPTNPDTDGDTASDGIERRFGGDPTVPDFNQFADSDGDGLVNVVETEGWTVNVEGISNKPKVCNTICNPGSVSTYDSKSDPNVPDSDFDGLLDGEEYSLGTDPNKKDTDGDGLTDFQEVRGIEVRDLGILTLDPLDADTDDDKLSDGQEVELEDIEADRWIVRVVGKDPYRVFSNPLEADGDFDRLADGDERANGSDPGMANTDGDIRDDYEEVLAGSRPWVKDFLVTVNFHSLVVDYDCDDGKNTGDFYIQALVNIPGSSKPRTVLTTNLNFEDKSKVIFYDKKWHCPPGNEGNNANFCRRFDDKRGMPSDALILIGQGNTLVFGRTGVASTSTSFGVAENETFGINAWLQEWDTDPEPDFRFQTLDDFNKRLVVDGEVHSATFLGSELKPGTMVITSRGYGDGSNPNDPAICDVTFWLTMEVQ